MNKYEFYSTTGIKLISISSNSLDTAANWFKINYPFWNFAYIVRV